MFPLFSQPHWHLPGRIPGPAWGCPGASLLQGKPKFRGGIMLLAHQQKAIWYLLDDAYLPVTVQTQQGCSQWVIFSHQCEECIRKPMAVCRRMEGTCVPRPGAAGQRQPAVPAQVKLCHVASISCFLFSLRQQQRLGRQWRVVERKWWIRIMYLGILGMDWKGKKSFSISSAVQVLPGRVRSRWRRL